MAVITAEAIRPTQSAGSMFMQAVQLFGDFGDTYDSGLPNGRIQTWASTYLFLGQPQVNNGGSLDVDTDTGIITLKPATAGFGGGIFILYFI